jgi:4'-phosphopantetheinyl transferase
VLDDDGGQPAHFNLSHSGDTCVIAISTRAPVGVDIEAVRDRSNLERLVSARFAPSEAHGVLRHEGEERRRAFYRVWTRKEAYLKATGLGLSAPLESFAVAADDPPALLSPLAGDTADWTLVDLDLGTSEQGAVALAAMIPSRSCISPATLPMDTC